MVYRSEQISTDIEGYLHAHEHKEIVRFVICGSADEGKSTLLGRLLYDADMIPTDEWEALQKESLRYGAAGEKTDFALLLDGLQSEREEESTIDVGYRYFSTEKRKFIAADAPGHEQYTRNMATGASTADLAVVVIDARYGIDTQTRRHSHILRLLGLTKAVVAVNKMDLLHFDRKVFEKINSAYRAFARELGIEIVFSVPLCALDGDNVVNRSDRTPWYEGKPLLDILEEVPLSDSMAKAPFRMIVQTINRPNLQFKGYTGTILSGTLHPGEQITVLPEGKQATLKSIVTYEGDLGSASAGEAVMVTLEEEFDISRGSVLVKTGDTLPQNGTITAHLIWMEKERCVPGKRYGFKRGSTVLTASVDTIEYRLNVNTMLRHETDNLELNDIGFVRLILDEPIAYECFEENRQMGGFILIDTMTNHTVAAGMIR